MIADKKVERLERCQVRLSLTVPQAEVAKGYQDLLKEYSRTVQIKGFRKGHVPQDVLVRKFGDGLKQEAMSRVMDEALREALEGEEARPIATSQPSLDGNPEFSLDKDFSFSVLYDALPVFEPGPIDGIEIEIPSVEILPEDEDRELEDLRDRNSLVVDKDENAKAEKGDVATINYAELDADGGQVDGSAREGFVFTVGSGQTLYDLDEDVIGMQVGDQKTVEKSYPADYRFQELAGQSRKIRLKLVQLKARKLPALDDDFAQDVSESFKTLADLRADIRKKLETRRDERLAALKERQVVEALLQRNQFDLPESLIRAELAHRYQEFVQRLGGDPATLDKLLAGTGKTLDALLDEWRPGSERALRTRFILEKLLEREKVELSQEELEAEYQRIAAGSGSDAAQVRQQYESLGYAERLRDRLREDKLFSLIYSKAKEKKGKKTKLVDLFAENQ